MHTEQDQVDPRDDLDDQDLEDGEGADEFEFESLRKEVRTGDSGAKVEMDFPLPNAEPTATDASPFAPPKARGALDQIEAIAPKLHKVLADAGIGSRREMEELILAGRVSVNGEPAHIGQRVQPNDQVRVNGKIVQRRNTARPPRVVLYHKTAGEIVTNDDPEKRATVFDRLPSIKSGRWVAVGRLDFNTEGLLLFTNSGDLANRLMHPRFAQERQYAVRCIPPLDEMAHAKLLEGVELEDGPAKFSTLEDAGGDGANHWYHAVISEGRNREVRRMFEAVGATVSRLIRIRYGDIDLPRNLRRGRWQEVTQMESAFLCMKLGMRLADPNQGAQRRGREGNKQRTMEISPLATMTEAMFGVSPVRNLPQAGVLTARGPGGGQQGREGNDANGNTTRKRPRPGGAAQGRSRHGAPRVPGQRTPQGQGNGTGSSQGGEAGQARPHGQGRRRKPAAQAGGQAGGQAPAGDRPRSPGARPGGPRRRSGKPRTPKIET
jgi:23S rRNA pseudouridine2605 synthase